MTDKITIERETLQAAFDALDYLGDCSDYDVTPRAWQGAKAEQVCTALRAALAAQPAEPVDSIHAELWRLAVRKGVVTVESKLIDDRNPNTRCSWMQGNDKACDISNDAAKVAGDRP